MSNYDASKDMVTVLGDATKNDKTLIRVSKVTTDKGEENIDIRLYVKKDGELTPTYKGIRFSKDLARNIIDKIEAACK